MIRRYFANFVQVPRPAFGDEDFTNQPVSGSPAAIDPSGATRVQERVEGEIPPDFSSIGTAQEPEKPTEGTEDTVDPSKGQEQGKAAQDPPKEKPSETPKEASGKLTEVGKTEKVEKPAEKAPEKPAESTEKKPEEKKSAIPEDDRDLDKLDVKPNAPEPIKNAVKVLKESTKVARAEVRKLQAELQTVTTKLTEAEGKTAAIPPEIEAELKALRDHRKITLLESDPAFQEEWKGKVETAHNSLLDYLKSHGLDDKYIEQIKATEGGPENWRGDEKVNWKSIKALLEEGEGGIAEVMKFDRLLGNSISIKEQRDQELAKLRADSETWRKGRQEQTVAQMNEWGNGFSKLVEKLSKTDFKWSQYKEVAGTDQEKAAALEHNKRIDEMGAKFADEVVKLYHRDPEAIARTMFRAHELDQVRRDLDAKDLELKEKVSELEAATKRIEELETKIGGIRQVGTMSESESPGAKSTPKPIEDGSAEEAIRSYWSKKS